MGLHLNEAREEVLWLEDKVKMLQSVCSPSTLVNDESASNGTDKASKGFQQYLILPATSMVLIDLEYRGGLEYVLSG